MKKSGMVLRATCLALFAFYSFAVHAQTDTVFAKEWAVIDSLILKQDLTKTALAKLEQLSVKANQRKLPAQSVKALIYRYSLQDRINTEDPAQPIRSIQAELAKAGDPTQKAVLYSLLATQYANYFSMYRWQLLQRKTTTGYDKKDISTWSAKDFDTAVINNYRRSLKDLKALQQQDVSTYDAVIIKGNTRQLRPTLFDLLAHAALDQFTAPDLFNTDPTATFVLSDPKVLYPLADFLAARFTANDSTNRSWQALKLFQELLRFHRNDADRNALIAADLRRIKWAYEQSPIANKASIHLNTLHQLTEQFPNAAATAEAWYQLAAFEINLASTYHAETDTTYRFSYNKAEQIILQALSLFPPSNIYYLPLQQSLFDIRAKQLTTETETVNLPGKPILAATTYRNTDTLYGRIYRITNIDEFYASNDGQANYWQKIKKLPLFRSFLQPLPVTNDHQQHRTYLKLNALPAGAYLLVTSGDPGFPDSVNSRHITAMQQLYVSRISYIKNENDVFVLDRETGKPIAGVKAILLKSRYNNTLRRTVFDTAAIRTTNKDGFFQSPVKNSDIRYVLQAANDTLNIYQQDYIWIQQQQENQDTDYEKKNSRVFFFTDRSIYRPGQTVFFKGIAVTKDKDSHLSKLIVSKSKEWVYLKDVNGKKIDSLHYTLNDYGSFSGSFRLPQSVLTGYFSISTNNFNQSNIGISVEEYKRPLFSVGFDKPKGSYRLNDTIVVTGMAKAYAGNPVSNAKLVYTVTRNGEYPVPYYKRIPLPFIPAKEIAHGEIQTDKNGRFSIRFKALSDDITDSTGNPLFNFSVAASVTDINGETRTASTGIRTGFQSLLVGLNVPGLTEKDSLRSIGISTTNLSGEKQAANVQVKIYALQPPNRLIRRRMLPKADQFTMSEAEFIRDFPHDEYRNESDPANWTISRTVWEQQINTRDSARVQLPAAGLPVGYYKIEAGATDDYGKPVTTSTMIQVIDRNTLASPVYDFNYTINTTIEPGEEAVLLNGTSADNIFVITSVSRQQQQTKKYDFSYRSAGMNTLRYTANESDRGGILVAEAFVYDNRVYTHQYMIDVPWTNKMMAVNFASYRNKTEPGSKETWSITINGPKVDSTAAELLTAMYDASLDQFRSHGWSTPGIWASVLRHSSFEGNHDFSISHTFITNNMRGWTTAIAPIRYDQLVVNAEELWQQQWLSLMEDPSLPESLRDKARQNYFSLNEQRNSQRPRTVRLRGNAMNAELAKKEVGAVATLRDAAYDQVSMQPAASQSANTSGSRLQEVDDLAGILQVRKDLNETAFFFPQLYADSTGKYSFSFTIPEALTQWKWMAFAHTKNLAFGNNTTTVITQKKLMVQPNMPRFLREGDRVELSAKIVNMTDKEISGQATLELFDATTNTAVDGWFNNVMPAQYFTIEAGESAAIQFPLQVPFSFNKPLTWRIIAKTANLSDGEENTLPVLTNRMLVTETLPIFLAKDTTQTFRFEKLLDNKSETLTHESLTIEYTSNPAWYAVQALPYLIDFPYECSEQTFNRFYANTLASYIVNRHPRLQEVFNQWKEDSTALLSNLQKNQELKQVLLEATPWVLQAETEEQQKRNIALLFDLARLSSQTETFIQKLEQLQLSDGSFSWFKGGRTDRYITNYILTGIGKLKRLGALTPDIAIRIRPILINALRYADRTIVAEYKELQKSKANLATQHVSNSQLDYLYMRSFFGDIAPLSTKEATYYYQQAKKYWTSLNSFYKAQLGLVAWRNREERFVAANVLPALLENTSTDTKLGMYWKTAYTCFWYQSPIEHQAMMIAFFSEAGSGQYQQQLDAMKTWLLLNKQTNNWKTTVATADACYALLLNGSDWMSTEKQVVIRLGNYTAASNLQKTEAGTGYFKKRIDGKIVNEQMGEINVSVRTNDRKISSPSWGSVYWQYFEDMDKISAAASPLALSKQLFKEVNTDKGKLLEPVKDGDELKVGDRIVSRIILRSDRDMDYLHLKDMRAASMEPVNVLSGYRWQDRIGYYESTKDVASDFFIDHLNKGTYVFEYPLFITHTGLFSVGIATIQNMYAPEFTSHSEGIKIRVSK